ncbi:hypothetical protein IAR55_005802 [Kwoniella newhampshirensis]|uniref:Uncharacterized protein n=1 Tax=Kwoniella newhampshirensis TaxID=1651941 RepID=A0AAW0YUS6_9TREE
MDAFTTVFPIVNAVAEAPVVKAAATVASPSEVPRNGENNVGNLSSCVIA